MARNIYDIFTEAKEIRRGINALLARADFTYYDDLSGVETDETDPDQLFLRDELASVLSDLDDAVRSLNYLSRPIKTEGTLHKQSNGRYEVNGTELTSGHGVEYLATDDRHSVYVNGDYQPVPYWRSSRIEHNGKDYYIVGADIGSLEGLTVRIR